MRKYFNFKLLFFSVFFVLGGVSVFSATQSIIFLLVYVVFFFVLSVWAVDIYATRFASKKLKKICEIFGDPVPPPHTNSYANGEIFFDGKFDIGTVSVINAGIHVFRGGLVSHLIKWSSVERVKVKKNTQGCFLRLFLNNGIISSTELVVPWKDDLNSALPERLRTNEDRETSKGSGLES